MVHYLIDLWFLKGNKTKHILSASYHPTSNNPAERFVQTVKALPQSQWGGWKVFNILHLSFYSTHCYIQMCLPVNYSSNTTFTRSDLLKPHTVWRFNFTGLNFREYATLKISQICWAQWITNKNFVEHFSRMAQNSWNLSAMRYWGICGIKASNSETAPW